jgi:hypothetical protein
MVTSNSPKNSCSRLLNGYSSIDSSFPVLHIDTTHVVVPSSYIVLEQHVVLTTRIKNISVYIQVNVYFLILLYNCTCIHAESLQSKKQFTIFWHFPHCFTCLHIFVILITTITILYFFKRSCSSFTTAISIIIV